MKSNSTTRRWRFEHHSLDAYDVALEALVQGTRILKRIPRGYAKLKNQGERALQGAFTQTTEAAARRGDDRRQRLLIARAEAGEAAGVMEALERMNLAGAEAIDAELELLWRLCAMLHQLSKR